jgi:hypothetical protein
MTDLVWLKVLDYRNRTLENCSCELRPGMSWQELLAVRSCKDRWVCPVLDYYRRQTSRKVETPRRPPESSALQSQLPVTESSSLGSRSGWSICYGCGREFRPRRKNQRYHDGACKQRAYRERAA